MSPVVAVTPPAFCNAESLRRELSAVFPAARFNTSDRYLQEPELIEFLQGADAALIGRDRIGDAVLRALPELKVISKYGVGLDNIDEDALRRRGVALGWTPGVNRRSVAELTLCFMLGLCHNVFSGGFALRQGLWQKDGGRELSGKTVGIVGCGHVGSEVLRLLAPFGCQVLINDIVDKSALAREYGARTTAFATLLEEAGIVTLHVPRTPLTEGFIDAAALSHMKPAAFLINTSRGAVVDEAALKAALLKGSLAGAALDVFAEEPPGDAELLALPNLIGTPHIGGNAREAVEAMGLAAIAHLIEFFHRR